MNYLLPKNIVKFENIVNVGSILNKKEFQVGLGEKDFIEVNGKGFLSLDFGKETLGGVRIITCGVENAVSKIRIRFGESLSESFSDIGEKNSTNDHSPRDFVCDICSLSDLTFGQTGFRFVRIDFLEDKKIKIKSILAEEKILNIPALYSYSGKDKLIEEIFYAGKRTIDLCASGDFVWDGIKRDRLVWIGDMHPEMLALVTLYGRLKIIEDSLNFIKVKTPLPGYMNWMPTYSMWWIIILFDYYKATGCKDFLDGQIDYLENLVIFLNKSVGDNGELNYDVFVDWPTRETQDEIVGSRIINLLAGKKAIELLNVYGKDISVAKQMVNKLLKGSFNVQTKKQVVGLKYFAFNEISDDEYNLLIKDGAKGLSTFMSYYILSAIASKNKNLAIKIMKEYYGKMLELGATTFFEDFNVEWAENACKLDELPKDNQKDIHGDFGAYCYVGFRHSLCHGWSSGVIKFIKENC